MKAIDAEEFAQICLDIEKDQKGQGNYTNALFISSLRGMISTYPTVDAVPVVHGRWQWLSSTYDRIPSEVRYRCDKCHHETITHEYKPWEKYCHNCGACMDLEEKHD